MENGVCVGGGGMEENRETALSSIRCKPKTVLKPKGCYFKNKQ